MRSTGGANLGGGYPPTWMGQERCGYDTAGGMDHGAMDHRMKTLSGIKTRMRWPRAKEKGNEGAEGKANTEVWDQRGMGHRDPDTWTAV